MTTKRTSGPQPKTVETLRHDEARRANIPTAEYQSLMPKEVESPIRVAYERRNRDLDPQLVWRGKDEQDWSDLVVQAPPLYIQEKVHPKVLVDDLLRLSRESAPAPDSSQPSLFADFNGIPEGADKTDFYQHDANWTNRMILGDSLQVMASLAEREGLRGKVQCIYIDPPYGIKFNSNFQWSTTSRDVKDGNAGHITREPEQVKAFRDTWRNGIHSYLTYLRDRLSVARDLLSDSGSVFVQIGDENVHRVRALLDEVFGEDNFVSQITVEKTSGSTELYLSSVADTLLWFSRRYEALKYRQFLLPKIAGGEGGDAYRFIETEDGHRRPGAAPGAAGVGARPYRLSDMTSQSVGREKGEGAASWFGVDIRGRTIKPSERVRWKTNEQGMGRLLQANRIEPGRNTLNYVRYIADFPAMPVTNIWSDVGSSLGGDKVYVVQTSTKIIERCLLMTTDPGDLVLDPTCGSGTTATVAEQWGRRWITIDTSRVALALARARIMGARYPYYLLGDSKDGQQKEAEVTRTAPSTQPTFGNIRHGFVYERVPHVTLKSIANNAEIDVIWEQHEERLRPLRDQLSVACGLSKTLEEWEIPREAPTNWPQATQPLLTAFWEARIARQKEIDASIAAKAEFEYLYDKPYEDKRRVRVAGPFTVESVSPHRMLAVDEDDELFDTLGEQKAAYNEQRDFATMILENLKTAGVQQAHKEDRISFTSLTPWPGDLVCAEGRYFEGADGSGKERRAGIFIGPEFGTVSRPDLVEAAREAGDANFDVLIACAFNYDAHSSEFEKLGRIPVLKARMNADLHMAADLKNTGKGNLFVIFGEPDLEVVSGLWIVARSGRLVANYERVAELSGLGSLEEINRVGGSDPPGFKGLCSGRALRADQPDAARSRVGAVEHRGGSGQERDGGIPSVPGSGERLAGGIGDSGDSRRAAEDAPAGTGGWAAGAGGGNQQDARWTQTLAGIATLTAADFPLSLTTSHQAQVTVHGVDVFHPSTGEVRSDGADGIACWFIDTDYNEESFFVRHAYFLGANDPYKSLKTTLKAEINEEAWESLHSDTSRPFDKPKSGRIAVKVINHLGDEVMKVFRVLA